MIEKRHIMNLIKYHVENDNEKFKAQLYKIANYFESIGIGEFSLSIMSMFDGNVFVPMLNQEDKKEDNAIVTPTVQYALSKIQAYCNTTYGVGAVEKEIEDTYPEDVKEIALRAFGMHCVNIEGEDMISGIPNLWCALDCLCKVIDADAKINPELYNMEEL